MAVPPSISELADRGRAEVADLLDLQLSPLGLAAIDALAPDPGQTVLDVGCGAGQTLLQLADRVGPRGRVVGVDIAPRVLDVARSRIAGLPNIELIQTDAATLALPEETVDGVFSRFGVMGFDDPAHAFANFRRMTKTGGRLSFACWRSLKENELDRFSLESAALGLPIDPTPFSFERRDYLADVLGSAGYRGIEIKAFDARVCSGDLDAMVAVLTKVGPLGKILRESPALLTRAEPRVRAALEARSSGGTVELNAATWIVTAGA